MVSLLEAALKKRLLDIATLLAVGLLAVAMITRIVLGSVWDVLRGIRSKEQR